MYKYSVYTVCLFSGEVTCSELPGLCDSPPETQGRAFHLFITTRCQLHLTPTLSYTLYIQYMYLYMKHAWHLHNKAEVEWGWRVSCLFCRRNSGFRDLIFISVSASFNLAGFLNLFCPLTSFLAPGCQALNGIYIILFQELEGNSKWIIEKLKALGELKICGILNSLK